jgi:hypothetical protein
MVKESGVWRKGGLGILSPLEVIKESDSGVIEGEFGGSTSENS